MRYSGDGACEAHKRAGATDMEAGQALIGSLVIAVLLAIGVGMGVGRRIVMGVGRRIVMGVGRGSGSTSEDRVQERRLVMREKRPWLDRQQKHKEAEPVLEGTADLLDLSTGGGWCPEVKRWRRQSRECLNLCGCWAGCSVNASGVLL